MNYEMAKQLKEAGFSQYPKPHSCQTFVFDNDGGDGGSFYMICPTKEGCCGIDFWRPNTYEQYLQAASDPISPANNPPEVVKLPTLAELIMASPWLMSLERQIYHPVKDSQDYGSRKDCWIARNMTAIQADREMGETVDFAEGSTPEEAVTHLWLKLKSKVNKPYVNH